MAGMMIVIPVPPTTISMKMAWLAEDCDDHNAAVNPGQRELFYNGVDDD